jgi:hypothetical protein
MFWRIGLRVLLGIVLLAAAAGLGVYTYNLGVAHGLTLNLAANPASGAPAGGVVYPPYYPGFPGWHFGFGFGIFGLIIPILFFFLIFGLVRRLFFFGMAGRWMGGHWGGPGNLGMHGPWGRGPEHWKEGAVPPFVAEMHRKMHEAEANAQSQASPEHKSE